MSRWISHIRLFIICRHHMRHIEGKSFTSKETVRSVVTVSKLFLFTSFSPLLSNALRFEAITHSRIHILIIILSSKVFGISGRAFSSLWDDRSTKLMRGLLFRTAAWESILSSMMCTNALEKPEPFMNVFITTCIIGDSHVSNIEKPKGTSLNSFHEIRKTSATHFRRNGGHRKNLR